MKKKRSIISTGSLPFGDIELNDPQNNFITVVSGLPRSGTSLVMQILAAGGIQPLTDDLRQPNESNPRGYFEFDPVKRLRSDRSWIEQARGRAIKIIHLLLRELPVGSDLQYRVIFIRRAMEEVLASQRVMLEREGKKAGDSSVLAKVYQSQLEQAEAWLAAQPSFSVLRLEHGDLFINAEPTVKNISEFLGGGLDLAAMVRAIDPSLYRERNSSTIAS